MFPNIIYFFVNWFRNSNTFWLECWELNWRGFINYLTDDLNYQFLARYYNVRE
jgi:hypothetical protein